MILALAYHTISLLYWLTTQHIGVELEGLFNVTHGEGDVVDTGDHKGYFSLGRDVGYTDFVPQ
jgi:hypothetical protein